jgi:hypothetical protein
MITDLQAAARTLGLQLVVENTRTDSDLDTAFATFAQQHVGAVLVSVSTFYISRREQLAALAARHALPAIFAVREFALSGGLMSYGIRGSGLVSGLQACRDGGACRPRACTVLILRTYSARSRQTVYPVEQVAHRSGHPETMSPCCWNSACRQRCRDGIRRSNAARPYLGNDWCKRDGPRNSLRRAYPAGSFSSLRRCPRFDWHFITVTSATRNPSRTEGHG